jgi:flagellar P-ring protein precursor FlgI
MPTPGSARVAIWLAFAALAPLAGAQVVDEVRVKDVVALRGVQPIPLIGYGLVVGLNKTGDRRQTVFSAQSLANMLERLGLVVPGETIKVENIAAVLVTTELPPFSTAGARLDVTVSSIGDARSLQGGTLIATPLLGPDGRLHALAQGTLTLGGFGAGGGGNTVQVNHLTVGRVPGGALVQLGQHASIPAGEELMFALHEADFTSARRLASTVEAELGQGAARVVDAGVVAVRVPPQYRASVPDLLARIEGLAMIVDAPARVVINERTGTVVVGANVRIGAAAVAHGNLAVRISTRYEVSQPAPFSPEGQTVVVPQQQLDVEEADARLVVLEEGITLDAVVRALNALGATPRDIIAIMQALKAAGALHAELVTI